MWKNINKTLGFSIFYNVYQDDIITDPNYVKRYIDNTQTCQIFVILKGIAREVFVGSSKHVNLRDKSQHHKHVRQTENQVLASNVWTATSIPDKIWKISPQPFHFGKHCEKSLFHRHTKHMETRFPVFLETDKL